MTTILAPVARRPPGAAQGAAGRGGGGDARLLGRAARRHRGRAGRRAFNRAGASRPFETRSFQICPCTLPYTCCADYKRFSANFKRNSHPQSRSIYYSYTAAQEALDAAEALQRAAARALGAPVPGEAAATALAAAAATLSLDAGDSMTSLAPPPPANLSRLVTGAAAGAAGIEPAAGDGGGAGGVEGGAVVAAAALAPPPARPSWKARLKAATAADTWLGRLMRQLSAVDLFENWGRVLGGGAPRVLKSRGGEGREGCGLGPRAWRARESGPRERRGRRE